MSSPSPVDQFLANMRAKLAHKPDAEQRRLIAINIAAMRQRYADLERWATRGGNDPAPHAGLDAWKIERIIRELEAMRPKVAA